MKKILFILIIGLTIGCANETPPAQEVDIDATVEARVAKELEEKKPEPTSTLEPEPTPTPKPAPEPTATPTPAPKPEPTSTPEPVPTPTPQIGLSSEEYAKLNDLASKYYDDLRIDELNLPFYNWSVHIKENWNLIIWNGWDENMLFDESVKLLEKNISEIKIYELDDIIKSLYVIKENHNNEKELRIELYNPTDYPISYRPTFELYDSNGFLVYSFSETFSCISAKSLKNYPIMTGTFTFKKFWHDYVPGVEDVVMMRVYGEPRQDYSYDSCTKNKSVPDSEYKYYGIESINENEVVTNENFDNTATLHCGGKNARKLSVEKNRKYNFWDCNRPIIVAIPDEEGFKNQKVGIHIAGSEVLFNVTEDEKLLIIE